MVRRLALLVAALSCSGCASYYQTLRLDDRTGLYPATMEVDPSGVNRRITSVDPSGFKYVLLVTNSNVRPAGLAFTLRSALALAGITNVFYADELKAAAQDLGTELPDDLTAVDALRKFATERANVLVVTCTHHRVQGGRMHTSLGVTEARTGRVLLMVDHGKPGQGSPDEAGLLPVLNELHKWARQSMKGAA